MNETVVFSLTSNVELVEEICNNLGITPGKLTINHFADAVSSGYEGKIESSAGE